jgi:2-polyprenyl-3-methyl-5-hydroxy-6-metoxy-1,4-benzoquinol methylase
MNEVKRYTDLRDGRYLDIGCGFGGCLVAAARSGMTGTGLEVDTDRIDFAKRNILDHRLEEKARVLHLDVLEPGVKEQIGQFDLISCNDVAEHVLDVQQLFRNLGTLLRPGGLAYVEIPNRYCIGSVASDGHFGLFGITLLERPEAMQYHWQVYRYTYDVGHYLTCPEYLDLFAQNGLSAQLVNSLYHATQELGTYSDAVRQLERRAEEFRVSQNIDAETRTRVMDAYAAYLEKLRSDYLTASRQPAAQQIGFRNTYLRPFWTFVAKRV